MKTGHRSLSTPKGGEILRAQHDDQAREEQGGVSTLDRQKVQRPQRFQVLMHNDDYTTKEFVVQILRRFFQKSVSEAKDIMLQVHNSGIGLCGTYTKDIAESKIFKVTREAKKHGHPLLCTCEPE